MMLLHGLTHYIIQYASLKLIRNKRYVILDSSQNVFSLKSCFTWMIVPERLGRSESILISDLIT